MSDYVYEEKQVGKYTVKVVQDDDYENPRTEWDNLGTMACFHRNYDLGDKHNYSVDEIRGIVEDNNYISLPLFLYDHSGITMSTSAFSCEWDSGQVGIIFISKEDIRKEYNVKRISKKLQNNVIKYLIGEVELYDNYLTGEVYDFIVEDETGNCIDSCCGFFGNTKYCLEEGIASAKWQVKEDIKNHCEKVKIYIKNNVPFEIRQPLNI